ncbi:MAG: hypothetical protein P8L70_10970 [Halioglobus sp.]|nr:hypothetical protein [Halioglobus sp.]MDG2327239.1 hypothetical protein [Halioglobus sp.]
MSEPAHFEVRELGTGTNSANTKGNKQYMGEERRRKDRGRRHDDISGRMF